MPRTRREGGLLLHGGLFVGRAEDVVGVDVVVSGWSSCCGGGGGFALGVCLRELFGDQDPEKITGVLGQGLEDVADAVLASQAAAAAAEQGVDVFDDV